MKRIPKVKEKQSICDCTRLQMSGHCQAHIRPQLWGEPTGPAGISASILIWLCCFGFRCNSSCSKPAGHFMKHTRKSHHPNQPSAPRCHHNGRTVRENFLCGTNARAGAVWLFLSDCCCRCPSLVKSPFTDKSGFLQQGWAGSALVLLTPGCLKQMNIEPAQQLQNPWFKSASSEWPVQIWAVLLTHKHS